MKGLPVGLVLLGAYALPLFAPPGAAHLERLPEDAALFARLFPGVPALWVCARLACLALGVVLCARALGAALAPWGGNAEESTAAPGRRAVVAALAVAAICAAAAPLAAGFGRAGEVAFVLGLGFPAAVLWLAERRTASHGRCVAPGAAWPSLAVVLTWLVIRVALVEHAPRNATPTDFWQSFAWLLDVMEHGTNVLAASGQPGVGNLYMLFVGLPVFEALGQPAELVFVQRANLGWLALTGLGIAHLARRTIGPSAGPVAAAVFLFSPFVLLLAHSPSPFGFYTAVAVAILLCVERLAQSPRPSRLAALGALAGLATTSAYLLPVLAGGGAATAWLGWRHRRHFRIAHWVLAILVFGAGAWPGLPDAETLGAMQTQYVDTTGEWNVLEAVMLGQRSPLEPPDLEAFWHSGRPGPLDIALGGLLSPFAAARTPGRMWADTIFDPLGGALAALGFLVAWKQRRDERARALLILAALTLAPAMLSSAYDRASLTRNLVFPLAFALAAGLGFAALRGALAPRLGATPSALLAAVLAAVGGSSLFDVVNPRLLAASHMAIQAEALAAAPPHGGAVWIDHGPFRYRWMHVALIGRHLPQPAVPGLPYRGAGTLREPDGSPTAEVFMWSPAVERDLHIMSRICAHWPDAALMLLLDRSRTAAAFAARPAGPGWEPPLGEGRVASHRCAARDPDAAP